MTTFVAETTIARTAEDIWTYAADILRHHEWMGQSDPRLEVGDGRRVGDRGRERLRLGPFGWDVAFEVVTAEPSRRVAWRTDDPRFDIKVGLELTPVGPGSTRARYTSEVALHGRWRLLAPLLAMEGAAGVRRELEQLRTRTEAQVATTTAAGSSDP